MNVYYPFDASSNQVPRGVALGFFDGVHRGHQDLIKTLVYRSEQLGLTPAVFTFPNHPLETISPEGQFAGYLTTLEQRLKRLADAGVAETFLEPFTPDFAAMQPEAFLNQIIADKLNTRLIVVGKDYRFGHEGEGDLEYLKNWAQARQIEIIAVADVSLYGEKISSSRIRRLVASGDADLATSCLGQPFQLTGRVIEGKKLGRKLGFPTANINIAPDLVMPAFGVYATRTRFHDRIYESITNIGIRPTLQDDVPKPNVESFLLDATIDLYGQEITVEFLHRLRPEKSFDSLLELAEQVKLDLEETKIYHRTAEQGYELARIHDIPVRIIKTSRFAQATGVLTFRMRISRSDATRFSLLSRLLTASCRRYPSRSSLSAALDNFYGASLESEVSKDGDILSLHFAVNALMHWTQQTSPFAQALDLLFDLIQNPDLDAEGHFHEALFAAEREGLRMELLARENDKAKYALDHCMQQLCGDSNYGLRAAGDLITLETIQREDLILAYRQMIETLDFQVALAGDLSNDLLAWVLDRVEHFPRQKNINRPKLRPGAFNGALVEPSTVRESRQIEQARICLAFTGLQPYFSHHSIVDTVLNSMLGGDVHSLLFEIVREQMGLAYSVYSVNNRYLSTMLVIAGIAPDRVDEALSAILDQLELLKTGQFSPSLFERAKTLVDSHIRSIPDDLDSMLSHLLNGVTLGRTIAVSDSLSLLYHVTPEQIITRANQLQLKASFVLTAKEEQPVD